MIYVKSKEKDLNTPQMPLAVKSCNWPLDGLHSRLKGPKNVSGGRTSLASLQFSSCFTKSCLFLSVCKKKEKGKEIGQQLPLKVLSVRFVSCCLHFTLNHYLELSMNQVVFANKVDLILQPNLTHCTVMRFQQF